MKFSVLFRNPEAARRAHRELTENGLLQWEDITSIHERQIRVDKLPLAHTSARKGALVGGLVVGVFSAVVLAVIAAANEAGFSSTSAAAFGLAVGALYGGAFGAIAFSTRPAEFIRRQRDRVFRGAALLVCDIANPSRAGAVREHLNDVPGAIPS